MRGSSGEGGVRPGAAAGRPNLGPPPQATVRVASQIRSPNESKIRMGTAFDKRSTNWVRLSPSGFGRYRAGLGYGEEQEAASAPPADPPRETVLPSQEDDEAPAPVRPVPETRATVTVNRQEAEDLLGLLTEDLPKVEKGRAEGRMGVCLESPSAAQIVTATRLRSRLENFLADLEGPSGLAVTAEEVLAAEEIGKCADRLGGNSAGGGLRKAAPVLAVLAGVAVLYFVFGA